MSENVCILQDSFAIKNLQLEKKMQPIWLSKFFQHYAIELPYHWLFPSIHAAILVTENKQNILLRRRILSGSLHVLLLLCEKLQVIICGLNNAIELFGVISFSVE